MESVYEWRLSDMRAARDHAQAAHTALVSASTLLVTLVNDMEADTTWSGRHKVEFMAWLDLLKQYHARLVDAAIGPEAVAALDGFLSGLSGYYQDSAVFASLRGVG
ncbi:MAG: hypothetical protein LBK42_07655 [Propionibacteriaceae bacterium]|jgi:hypothetical protein|nr:hypothetical protein [Propionibacteriaceae bacterium]